MEKDSGQWKRKKKLKVKVNTLREKFLSPFPSNSDIGLLRSIYNRFGNLSNVYRIRKPAQCNCIRPIITFHSLYILVTSSSFVSQTFGVRSVKKSLAFFFFFRLTIGSSLIRNFILKIYFQKKKNCNDSFVHSLFLRRFYLIKKKKTDLTWSLREDNSFASDFKIVHAIHRRDLSVKVYQNKRYFAIEILHLKHYL